MRYLLLGGALAMSALPLMGENDFSKFMQEQESDAALFSGMEQAEFEQYQMELEAGFKAFEQTYQQEFNQFKQQITQQWGEFRDGDKKNWVSYTENGTVRRSVNYEKGTIEIEVLAGRSTPDATLLKRAQQQAEALLGSSEKDAFELDQISQKVEQRLQQMSAVVQQGNPSSTRRVLAPLIPQLASVSPSQLTSVITKLLTPATSEVHKAAIPGKKVMRVSLTIPPTMANKVGQFEQQVRQIALKEKISPALVYAIMETESDFNPRAKSHIPAYGLMQIVPVSAGKDSTAYLFGKAKVLAPSYLYDSNKNIEIGGAYLHILYHRYLKAIENPETRLYCAIAAYNTGAGNVARTFSGTNNVKKAATRINQMSPDEVYEYLVNNLPHAETQRYMKKVTSRMKKYL